MAKTLDQLDPITTLTSGDLFLVQQAGEDKNITYGNIKVDLTAYMDIYVPTLKVLNAFTADTALAIDWSNISNPPATWTWAMITGTPTSLAGYGIVDVNVNRNLVIPNTFNQFTIGTTNTTTLNFTAPTAPRVYTIPDSGGAGNIMPVVGTAPSANRVLKYSNTSGVLTNSNISDTGSLVEILGGTCLNFANATAITLTASTAGTIGKALTVKAGDTTADGTARNVAGGDLTLKAGQSVGTSSSNVVIQTPTPAGSAGKVLNALATRLTINEKGLNIASVGSATANAGYLFKTTGTPAPVGTDKLVYDGAFFATSISATNVTSTSISATNVTFTSISATNVTFNGKTLALNSNLTVQTGAVTLTGNVAGSTLVLPSGSLTLPALAAIGDIPYASSTSALGVITAVAAGQILTSAGAGVKPAWSAAPVLNTSLTVPTVFGSSTTAGNLTLRANSANLTTGAVKVTTTVESSSTTTGAVIIDGGVGVAKNLYAAKVFNAVWNDIADFVEVPDTLEIEYGRVYVRTTDFSVAKSSGYMQPGALGVASDTFGFGVGQKDNRSQLPIAIGGFVLAYVDKVYSPGTPLTCTADGGLTAMSNADRAYYPERIIAMFDRPELLEDWNGIVVNGRHWVKVM